MSDQDVTALQKKLSAIAAAKQPSAAVAPQLNQPASQDVDMNGNPKPKLPGKLEDEYMSAYMDATRGAYMDAYDKLSALIKASPDVMSDKRVSYLKKKLEVLLNM